MRPLVVLFAVICAAVAAPQLLVQPPNTAEGRLLKKRSIGHAVSYAVPAAVSHQSRVDIRSSPAVVQSPIVEPVVEARAVYAAPATVYAAPATTNYVGGSAVSHQSRVDVRTSPAVVSEHVLAPAVVAEPTVVDARAVYAAAPAATVYAAAPTATVYAGSSAVSHQSRVDVHSSPALVTEQLVAPAVVDARSFWAPSVYASTW